MRKYLKLSPLVVYSAVTIVSVFFFRWDSLSYPFPMNPDEAQTIANAMRVKDYGYSWNAVDSITTSPVNSLVSAIPYIIGISPSYFTARFTMAVMLCAISIILFYIIRKACRSNALAIAFSVPLVASYALTENYEFLHLNSETPSLLFILSAIAFYFQQVLSRVWRKWSLFAIGALLAAASFAKVQSAPLAATTYVFTLVSILQYPADLKVKIRLCSFLFAGSCMVLGLLFAPLLFSGSIEPYLKNIEWTFIYVQPPISFLQFHAMVSADGLLRGITYFICIALLGSLLFRPSQRASILFSCFAISLLCVAVFSIMRPGNTFLHYLTYLMPFLIFCAAIAWNGVSKPKLFLAAFLALFVVTLSFTLNAYREKHAIAKPIIPQNLNLENPEIYSWLVPSENPMLVWGWMPQWYYLAGMTPATRESITFTQLANSSESETSAFSQLSDTRLRDYYRTRFMNDLKASKPGLIIDSTVPGSFYFNDNAQYGIHAFPELDELIRQEYTPATKNSEVGKQPLYVRNDLLSAYTAKSVKINGIRTEPAYQNPLFNRSLQNLNDYSILEGHRYPYQVHPAPNYWLLPDSTLGKVVLTLEGNPSVRGILLLNSQNGHALDRATDKVKISLRNDSGVVWSKEIAMDMYPYWTQIDCEAEEPVNQVEVEILSFHGLGAGLNEIKVFGP